METTRLPLNQNNERVGERGTSAGKGDDRAERPNLAFQEWLDENRDSLPEKGARAALWRKRCSATYEDDVEDCRQEVFVRLWCPDVLEKLVEGYEQPDGPPDPQRMERYAVGAATNMARSYLRSSSGRHQRRCVSSACLETTQVALDNIVGPDAPVDARLIAQETWEQITLAFTALPPETRYVIVRVVQEGQTYKEIAREMGMGMTLHKVRYRVQRGLDQLRGMLREV